MTVFNGRLVTIRWVGSGVPVPVHVEEPNVEREHAPDLIEAPVALVVVSDQLPVGSIAEWCICRVLAIA